MDALFLGETVDYWLKLKSEFENKNLTFDYFKEVLALRIKVSFYESRLDEMNRIKNIKVDLSRFKWKEIKHGFVLNEAGVKNEEESIYNT